jgi:DNA-binding NtrC family response regulator
MNLASNQATELNLNTSSVSFPVGMRLREAERIVILETLRRTNFNRTHTARALGIGIRTLQRKLKRYGASDWGLKPSTVDSNSASCTSVEG